MKPFRIISSCLSLSWLQPAKLTAISALLLLFSTLTVSEAIIVRHDVGADAYVVESVDYPSLFYLERQGARRVCAATVIHRQWAITAAHCLEETLLGATLAQQRRFGVQLVTGTREIDLAIVHPDYDQSAASDVDLALLRFREESAMPRPMNLYTRNDEVGRVAELLGWGFTGLGTTGRQYDDGRLRRALNRIEQSDARLRLRFDDPREPAEDALSLEGTLGLGDSGGPALIADGGSYLLAGVAIGEVQSENYSEERQGQYVAIAIYERVSRHIDWIEAVVGESLPFES